MEVPYLFPLGVNPEVVKSLQKVTRPVLTIGPPKPNPIDEETISQNNEEVIVK